MLSRWRTEAEGALALYCDFIDRELLLQADPEVFFITEHYRTYPSVLAHLDRLSARDLSGLLARAIENATAKRPRKVSSRP